MAVAEPQKLPIEVVRRYGYINVVSSFLTWGLALATISMMMPVLYDSIRIDTGWTLGQTTAFMVIKSTVSAVTGLTVGQMFLKFGLKRSYVVSVAAIGLCTMMLYFAHSLTVYYAVAATTGFFSIICMIAFQVVLARWFSARLGTFTGISFLGGALAGAVVPLTVTYLVRHYGWQSACAIVGFVVFVVLTSAVGFLVHETPEQYGYTSDELDPGKHDAPSAITAPGEEFASVLRSRRFWVVLAAVFASGAFSNGINEHTPLFLAHHAGFSKVMAAAGFSVVLMVSGLGKILFGWVFDRLSTKGIAACWALCGIAVALAFPVNGLATFLVFTVVRGLAQGGVVLQAPVLARHMFGLRPVGQVIAFLNAAFHLGAAAGIGAIGLGFDYTGSYNLPFLCVIVLAGVASVAALGFRPVCWAHYRGADAAAKAPAKVATAA